MDKTDFASYKELFVDTARDYVTEIELSITKLENDPVDSEAISKIHIATHSIKSQCFAMGFASNARLFKILEDIFSVHLSEKKPVSPDLITELKNFTSAFVKSIEKIQTDGEELDLSNEAERLRKHNSNI